MRMRKRYGNMMQFTLAHLSDVHLAPLPPVSPWQLMSKRITGYINWQRHRRGTMGTQTLDTLLKALAEKAPDHIAVTGDLTNLALPAEFDQTRTWLSALGEAEEVSVIPGNHDAYVRDALESGLKQWAPWLTDDNGNATLSNTDFPYVRVREGVQIIGCSSAVATPPFIAAGHFGEAQGAQLAHHLKAGRENGLFRVVLIHHPPVRGATIARKRLYGIGRFQTVIEEQGAELVLHGHTHLPQRHFIEGPDKHVPVYGVPAASEATGRKRPPGAFNLFKIERATHNTFKCSHEEWSVSSTDDILLTDENQLY